MQHLPEGHEKEWILDGLAELVRRAGPVPLVARPIVEVTRRFFPDPYSPTLPGVDRLTRRLLQYAGLGDLDVRLEPYVPDEEDDRHSLAYFAGIENGIATFGINVDQVADLEPIAAVMAHEAAHAFRRRRGLAVEDREEEELLTDLTTVYLGLGVLTTNGSWRYRASGEIQGSWAITSWVTTAAGYLPAQAFSFALGAQLVLRDPPPREWRRVLAALETNQRAFARAALDELVPEREALARRLGLPDRATWPAVMDPREVLAPLPPAPPDLEETDPEPEPPPNAGRPVFRVHESHVVLSTVLVGLVAAFGGFALSAVLTGSPAGSLAGLGGAAFGLWAGLRGRRDVCSDPECRTTLAPSDHLCAGCGGTVAGRIRYAEERLEAEEKLLTPERGEDARALEPE